MLAAIAVLVGYWPLAVGAVLLCALGDEWVAAVLLGTCFDLLYGRPPAGYMHIVSFPFVVLALSVVLLERLVRVSLRRTRSQDFL